MSSTDENQMSPSEESSPISGTVVQAGEQPKESAELGKGELTNDASGGKDDASDGKAQASDVKKEAAEKKPPSFLFDGWPLSEESTRYGLLALIALVLLAAFYQYRTATPSNGAGELNGGDSVYQDPADPRNHAPPPPNHGRNAGGPAQPLEPTTTVSFTSGQRAVVFGAKQAGGFSLSTVKEFIDKYKMYIGSIVFMSWSLIVSGLGMLGALGWMNIGMFGVAVVSIIFVYASWPRGPDGDDRKSYAKFVLVRIAMVVGTIAMAGMAMNAIYFMVARINPEIWVAAGDLISAVFPALASLVQNLWQTRVLPLHLWW